MTRPVVRNARLLAAILLLPLAGALLSGKPLRPLFRFPPPPGGGFPRTFAWPAALAVLGLAAAVGLGWIRRAGGRTAASGPPERERGAGPFPAWGWVGLAWTAAWWAVAWTRLPPLAPIQPYTFFPLWLGFIVAANALASRVGGSSAVRRRPGQWLLLFAASAGFWWVFEWLNRFVRNWHYHGVESFGPARYALHATLCFSTVLPAVAAVRDILRAIPRWAIGTARGPAWAWLNRRSTARILAGTGSAGLFLTGIRPEWFYPALWSAPLALALADDILSRTPGIAAEMAGGDWREAASWAAAGLICGFFWEMWNWRSLAHWTYTVPFVDRWHLFEMPLLGYSGYLPFGLECYCVWARLFGRKEADANGAG